MSGYFPPTANLPTFDSSVFNEDDAGISANEANLLFLKRTGVATSVASSTSFAGIINADDADFSGVVNFNSLISPPHCPIAPSSDNDLCNKLYVDSQASLTSYQLFLNYSNTFTTPAPASITYKELSPLQVLTPSTVPFTVSTTTPQLIAGFFNTLTVLNIPLSIPSGLWTLLCYSNVDTSADQGHIALQYTLTHFNASGVEVIFYTSPVSALLNVISPLVGASSVSGTFPAQVLPVGTVGIGMKLFIVSNTASTKTGNIFFQNADDYSSILTSFAFQQAPDLLNLNNIWTGSNTFNGGLAGNGSGLTNLNASSVSTTSYVGGVYYPVMATSSIGASPQTLYTSPFVEITPGLNTVAVGNLNIKAPGAILSLDGGNIQTSSGFNSNMTINTNLTSTGSIQLRTQSVNRLTINSAGIATFSSPPIMSGNSITAGTIPINAVVGTAVNVNGTQTITGTKTFSNTIIADISGTSAVANNALNVDLGTTVAISNYLVMSTTNTGQSALKTSTVTYDPTFNELNCSITGNSGTTTNIDIINDSAGGISRNFIMGPVSGVSNPYASSTLSFAPNTSILNFSGSNPTLNTSSQDLKFGNRGVTNITLGTGGINVNGSNLTSVVNIDAVANNNLSIRSPAGSTGLITISPKNVVAFTARDDGVCQFSNAPRYSALTISGTIGLSFPLEYFNIINISGTTTGTITLPLPVSGVNDGTQILFKRRQGTGIITFDVTGGGSSIVSAVNTQVISVQLSATQFQTSFICVAALWYQTFVS